MHPPPLPNLLNIRPGLGSCCTNCNINSEDRAVLLQRLFILNGHKEKDWEKEIPYSKRIKFVRNPLRSWCQKNSCNKNIFRQSITLTAKITNPNQCLCKREINECKSHLCFTALLSVTGQALSKQMTANPCLERCGCNCFIRRLFHSINLIAKFESGKDFWRFIILVPFDVWIVY